MNGLNRSVMHRNGDKYAICSRIIQSECLCKLIAINVPSVEWLYPTAGIWLPVVLTSNIYLVEY